MQIRHSSKQTGGGRRGWREVEGGGREEYLIRLSVVVSGVWEEEGELNLEREGAWQSLKVKSTLVPSSSVEQSLKMTNGNHDSPHPGHSS